MWRYRRFQLINRLNKVNLFIPQLVLTIKLPCIKCVSSEHAQLSFSVSQLIPQGLNLISVLGCCFWCAHCHCLFQLLLSWAAHTSLLSNHFHVSILLAYQTAHPTRHVVLKPQMKGDMVNGEPLDNKTKVFGIEGVMLIWAFGSCWRAHFGCWHTKRDSGCSL